MTFQRLGWLMKKSGFSKTRVYGLIREGLLPKPVKVGRSSVWVEDDVEKALAKIVKNQKQR